MSVEFVQQLAKALNAEPYDFMSYRGETDPASGESIETRILGFRLDGIIYSFFEADSVNAGFIVWSIERLNELGMTPCISVHAVGYTLAYGAMPDVYLAGGKQFENYPEGCFERRSYTAKTLAECCAQALLTALAASPAQAPGLSNTEGTADQSDSTTTNTQTTLPPIITKSPFKEPPVPQTVNVEEEK